MNWLDKFIVSERGQWDYPGYPTVIPTKNGRITMEGVPYPVIGFVPGQPPVMMQPGKNYKFPGNMVYEIPVTENKVFKTKEDFYRDLLLQTRNKYWPKRESKPFDLGFDSALPRVGPGPIKMPTIRSSYTGIAMKQGGHILPGRLKNPEGNWVSVYANGGDISIPDLSRPNWLDKYQSKTTSGSVSKSGPRIENLPIQKVDNKLEIAYDGSTVYVRKIGEEKFTTLNPEKSKAFIQKYQGFIPPTLTQVEEQKKKQAAYNAKIAKEKKEFDELRKVDTTPNPREKEMMIELARKERAELGEKGFLEQAWDALPNASSITDPIKRAYHALPDVGDVSKVASGMMGLPEELAKQGVSYLWNNYKVPQTDIPVLRSIGELTPKEIYESFQNRYVEKNFGEAGLIGESNLEEFNVLDETSGTSNMQELPKSRAKYGPQSLPLRKDSRGNLLPAYQPIGGNDSLARFSYTFNNDIAGADSLPPTHFVTPKIKELTGNPDRPRQWDNAFAVGDFLRDADITENQFYHPDKYYVGTSNSALRNSDLGIKSNKLISASNQLINDPEKYWAVYKWDPKNSEAAWVRYMKTDEIKSKKDELEKQGWSLDMPVSGQHRFDDVDWEGKGSDTGYKADSEWVPLKKGAKQIKSQKGVNHTYIPQGTSKGQDKGTYNLFSGGSITFIWKDPETNERLASTLAGSVSDMKAYGEKLKKEYGLKEGDLEIVYHDTGSYSAKPAAKDGTLYYDQWKNYNAYNKGYSGAALIVPTQDWLENWTPNKKEGGQLDKYQSKDTGAIKKGWHQKVYNDPDAFAKANKAFNDSLNLSKRSYELLKDIAPNSSYKSNIPYEDVYFTADGPGGYFIDNVDFGRQFLGLNYLTDTNFRIPGTKEQLILEEAFSKRIKPIGFNTTDFPVPIYKWPTEEPVYEELKNLPYLDAKLERPDFKLDIGKPPVKSQGIRIRPMMTADQTTSTGQYQSGKYMWDPETKSWKVKMLSPETQQENRKEVRIGIKKYGGWLDKYQDGKEVKTYANDPSYFDNRAVFVDNPQANDLVRSKVYAGTHGWDPNTNSLVKLDKPVAVPKAVQEMSTADWGKKRSKERFESNTPAGKATRKAVVARDMQQMVQNPAFYAPGAIAAGALAAPALAGVAGTLTAPLTIGSTVVPGATMGNALAAGFAADALVNRLPQIPGQLNRGEYSDAAINAATGLLDVGSAGMLNSLYKTATKAIKSTYAPSELDIIRGLLKKGNQRQIEIERNVKPVQATISQNPYSVTLPTLTKEEDLIRDSYNRNRWSNDPGFWRWYNKKHHGLDYDRPIKRFFDPSDPGHLSDTADDANRVSFFDSSEMSNIDSQIKQGNTWLQDWFKNPATAQRIANTGFDESSLVRKNINDFVDNKNVVRFEPSLSSKIWTGNELGSYFPKSNKAYVDAEHFSFMDGTKSIPSTVIHEGTHLTSAGELAYNQKLTDLTADIFRGSDASEFAKMFRTENDIKKVNKLTSPAETHARIMQIRQQYNIKPEQIVDDTVINKIIEDGLSGKLPVSKKFFELIQNKDAFKKAMNTLPAIGAGVAIGTGGLQEKKTGGSTRWLDRYQDGGSREMPLGLPLREQNVYLLPEYNQPMANGYILPDPNRPELMNTGATEYKYSYGMDDRDVQVPSVVAGQYIGDRAFDRYMISGEEFKPMVDPSSYSQYYDMLNRLGLMKQKKGGEMSPSMGYFNYIGGYGGMLP